MSIRFNKSDEPTLGVEVELQIVDLETRALSPRAPEVLAALEGNPHVKTELLQSTIELNTGVCRSVKEVRRDLASLNDEVIAVCDRLDCGLMFAGTHPFSTWPEQQITDEVRYRKLVDRVQWPAQRLMIFGLHVHVGMDSGEKAVAVFDHLSNYIPQFLALSASSPFWQGNDTGLASVRIKVFETLPTAGLPEQLVNWGEFTAFMNTLITAGAIESIREVWWDIRPHPGFGTVELRMCDGIPTMDELLSIVAFVHCCCVWKHRHGRCVAHPFFHAPRKTAVKAAAYLSALCVPMPATPRNCTRWGRFSITAPAIFANVPFMKSKGNSSRWSTR